MWVTLNRDDSRSFYDVLREIRQDASARATAVVAVAFVEDHLTQLIKRHLVQAPVNRAKNPIEDMFMAEGPLGEFGTKIDFAYLTARISKEACLELHAIRGIRNQFAYKIEMASFDDSEIAERCAELKRWEAIKIKLRAGDRKAKGSLVLGIAPTVEPKEQGPPATDLIAPEKVINRRGRFVAACEFYIAAFSIIQGAKNLSKPLV